MAGPPDLPTVRHYADGRQVLVTSMAEFDALEPGHASQPLGPFDEPDAAAAWHAAPTEDEDPSQQARQMRQQGMSQQAIADALGVARRTVRQWLAHGEADDDS